MKKIFLLGSMAVAGLQTAHAVDIKAGDWTVSVGGIINAFYTTVSCSGAAGQGIALAGRDIGCGGQDGRTTIGNGLLPSGLITTAKSKQGAYDVQATIGIMTATATDSAIGANSAVDVRQGFFSFGNADMGTIKLGRDYGMFGANAILNDMTLLGAGAPVQATQRGRVALGHIGAGYTYLGTYGQVAYSSPKFGGVQVDAALVSPVDNGGAFVSKTAPQFQGQVSYSANGLKTWLGAKGQKFVGIPVTSGTPPVTTPAPPDFTMRGVELGALYNLGPVGLLANVQSGKALGILADGDEGDVRSTNYLVQASFKPTEKLKLGLSYGMSKNRDDTLALKSNANLTLGSYYSITPSITLVGEIGQTRSKMTDDTEARMNGVSIGGIMFF